MGPGPPRGRPSSSRATRAGSPPSPSPRTGGWPRVARTARCGCGILPIPSRPCCPGGSRGTWIRRRLRPGRAAGLGWRGWDGAAVGPGHPRPPPLSWRVTRAESSQSPLPRTGELASGGEDGTVRLWDLTNPEADPVVLEGHEDWVYSVAFAPDGRTLPRVARTGRCGCGTSPSPRPPPSSWGVTREESTPSLSPRMGGWPRVARTGQCGCGTRPISRPPLCPPRPRGLGLLRRLRPRRTAGLGQPGQHGAAVAGARGDPGRVGLHAGLAQPDARRVAPVCRRPGANPLPAHLPELATGRGRGDGDSFHRHPGHPECVAHPESNSPSLELRRRGPRTRAGQRLEAAGVGTAYTRPTYSYGLVSDEPWLATREGSGNRQGVLALFNGISAVRFEVSPGSSDDAAGGRPTAQRGRSY